MLIGLGGRRLHYDLVGREDGPVLCMAHALSADSGIWADQVPPLLAAGWRVLRPDLRGHGGSDPGAGPCDMADLALDVIHLLDRLGFDKVHFAGLSIGGMIGQVLGIDHGHRLHSLMLCDTFPTTVPGGKAVWDERFATIRSAGMVEPIADATMDRWLTEGFRVRNPRRWQGVRATVAATSVDGYVHGGTAILHFDTRAGLPGITTPTLVMWGDEDPGTPPEGNRLIADLIPAARSYVFVGARHVPMIEYPDDFNRVMLDWLGPLA